MVKITEELVRKKSEHNERLISTLEELSLHQEDIECIEHLHNWCRDLKILLLQSNLIAKIENLYKLKRLEYLNLAINNIERVENLEGLESLEKLDLTLNFIGELTSIESLQGNYNLRELILTGNPCTDCPQYRSYVIATLPQLTRLDCEEITRTQKLQEKYELAKNRASVIQWQAKYAIQRDEQKIRFHRQKAKLESEMANMADEDDRIKAFWQSNSEHCPEIRTEIARFHKLCSQPKETKKTSDDIDILHKHRMNPQLFAPCGRPYNLNQAKLPFRFHDEPSEYILEVEVYKYLDTSHIVADIETNYIRITIKRKIFQIALNEEINISSAVLQRSQITGELKIQVSKLNPRQMILCGTPKLNCSEDANTTTTAQLKMNKQRKGILDNDPVRIADICLDNDTVPDLI